MTLCPLYLFLSCSEALGYIRLLEEMWTHLSRHGYTIGLLTFLLDHPYIKHTFYIGFQPYLIHGWRMVYWLCRQLDLWVSARQVCILPSFCGHQGSLCLGRCGVA